jgi:hypothetical protein
VERWKISGKKWENRIKWGLKSVLALNKKFFGWIRADCTQQ